MELANEQRGKRNVTEAQAFAEVFTDPKNAELAEAQQ
jgi:hypothetical protein